MKNEKIYQYRQNHLEWCKKVLRLMDERLEKGIIDAETMFERRNMILDMLYSAMERLDGHCEELQPE